MPEGKSIFQGATASTKMVCEEQLVGPAWGEEGGEVMRLLS